MIKKRRKPLLQKGNTLTLVGSSGNMGRGTSLNGGVIDLFFGVRFVVVEFKIGWESKEEGGMGYLIVVLQLMSEVVPFPIISDIF
mmetsp:Transcript_36660/g.76931  ORF Transcript_36660/g.76931 Transcript_36660/m.76931 type:complete len:85 (+) Transcript_36660:881-1135(+)